MFCYKNNDVPIQFRKILKSQYYNDKKSRNVRITGNDDWEMTVLENHEVKGVING